MVQILLLHIYLIAKKKELLLLFLYFGCVTNRYLNPSLYCKLNFLIIKGLNEFVTVTYREGVRTTISLPYARKNLAPDSTIRCPVVSTRIPVIFLKDSHSLMFHATSFGASSLSSKGMFINMRVLTRLTSIARFFISAFTEERKEECSIL